MQLTIKNRQIEVLAGVMTSQVPSNRQPHLADFSYRVAEFFRRWRFDDPAQSRTISSMNPTLIYHTAETARGGVSPFDVTIMEMVEGHDLRIACPYLGLDYLRRMIAPADGWRLVTDVPEWLSIHPAKERGELVDFILNNGERIHHCRDLHAKVLIAGNEALVGSANFTKKGITGRVEMSVRIESTDEVKELKGWFDLLWSETAFVKEPDLRACAANLPESISTAGAFVLPSAHPGVHAVWSGGAILRENADTERNLIERVRMAPDRRWAVSWLDLAKEIIGITGLSNEDERLTLSMPVNGKTLPVIINSRIVLVGFGSNDPAQSGMASVVLILPESIRHRLDTHQHSIAYEFKPKPAAPLLIRISMPSVFTFDPDVLASWHEACIAECGRQTKSNFRKFHETAVYRVIMDSGYRRIILDRAFGDS